MPDTAAAIEKLAVPSGQVAVFWLGQAGFVFKTSAGLILYVDPYLTDCVEKTVGFRRLMPSCLRPEEVRADLVLFTHEHPDHLDSEAVPVIARHCQARFAGPDPCLRECRKLGIPEARLVQLNEGDAANLGGATVTAVPADHGTLAPQAVGLLFDFRRLRVYVSGDTAFRPDRLDAVARAKPEVIIPVINGAFGNMNALEAARLTAWLRPRIAIPAHFWTFAEQNGDPGAFVTACAEQAPDTRVTLIQQGAFVLCSR